MKVQITENSDLNDILAAYSFPAEIKNLSVPELEALSKILRRRILEVTSHVGGHLASSLGTVECTLALYNVFNPADHVIVWDVGHQAYSHKILTGRNQQFSQIGKQQGIAKFLRRQESEFDYFGAGHASTSISAALGISIAESLKQNHKKVIALIGDGALTGGLSFEALNHLGQLKNNFLVILNDNEMSIDQNVGALSKTFNLIQTNSFYNKVRSTIKRWGENKKLPKLLTAMLRRTNDSFMEFLSPKGWVEALHLRYIGPIDGHNVQEIVDHLKKIEQMNFPVMLHLRTVKGKGYVYAEQDSVAYHGVAGFNLQDGEMKKNPSPFKAYTKIWSETFEYLFKKDQTITAISAAMVDSVGIKKLYQQYPKRVFDVGIAEAQAVCMAAGMATRGLKPFVAIYSTFLQRAYDQIIHDVALQNLNVRFILDRAGFVGPDGATHHGVFDLSYLRIVPNFVLMAPRNGLELSKMIIAAYCYNNGPIAIRFPRGNAHDTFEINDEWIANEINNPLPIGKAEICQAGEQVAILAFGVMVQVAFEVCEHLSKKGLRPQVVDMKFIKPLDETLLKELAKKFCLIATIEENATKGGAGAGVLEFYSQQGIATPVTLFGAKDEFIEYGTVAEQRLAAGIDAPTIAEQIWQNYCKFNPGNN